MQRPIKALVALTCLSTLFAYACAADETSTISGGDTNGGPSSASSGGGGTGGADAGPSGSTSSGEGGGIFTTSSAGGSGQGGSCVDLEFEAEFVKRPSDIIFVIDNSGSMSDEINGVETNINVNFANIIQSSGIDYRVIMVTDHGNSSLDVCVQAPLSGTTDCTQPAVEVPSQFYHYDVNVQSFDGACVMLDTMYGSNSGGEADEGADGLAGNGDQIHPGGWVQYLRPEAVKVFVMITDDQMRCSWNGPGSPSSSSCDSTTLASCFNDEESTDPSAQSSPAAAAALNLRNMIVQTAPAQFGSQNGGQNFLWYSIVNMPEKANPADAYGPNEPLGTTMCDPGWGLGTGYQWLSKGTDAARFPICAFQSYDAVFQEIAAGVEEGTAIPCEFNIPDTEDPIADDTWAVEYTPGDGGASEQFDFVASEGACQDDDEFYVDGDVLKLCPLACNKVSGDSGADINVIALCAGTID